MIPCSHIGHLFRISTYSFGSDKELIKHRNNIRILEAWMDDYKEIYYSIFPREYDFVTKQCYLASTSYVYWATTQI